MTRKRNLGIVTVAIFATAVVAGVAARVSASQLGAAADIAASAAKASPELVGELSKAIGGSPAQAAGAAGALFGVAKSRLSPDQFSQVAKAVPGMDSLLKASPIDSSGLGGLSQAAGGAAGGAASGLSSATSAFTKLGLSPDMVNKAVPILTSYVTKSGGANVGQILAGAFK
jgi:hypothetical protein